MLLNILVSEFIDPLGVEILGRAAHVDYDPNQNNPKFRLLWPKEPMARPSLNMFWPVVFDIVGD